VDLRPACGTWWYDRTGKTNGLIVLSKFVFTVHRSVKEEEKMKIKTLTASHIFIQGSICHGRVHSAHFDE